MTTMTRLRKVLFCLIGCVVLPLVFALAITVVPGMFHVVPYAILTGSMTPAVPVGSLVYVDARTSAGDLSENDIVAFESNALDTHIVAHRVVGNDTDRALLETKGDANSEADPLPVPYDAVKGKAVLTLPNLGFILMWIERYRFVFLGLLSLLLIPVVITSRARATEDLITMNIPSKGEPCKKTL